MCFSHSDRHLHRTNTHANTRIEDRRHRQIDRIDAELHFQHKMALFDCFRVFCLEKRKRREREKNITFECWNKPHRAVIWRRVALSRPPVNQLIARKSTERWWMAVWIGRLGVESSERTGKYLIGHEADYCRDSLLAACIVVLLVQVISPLKDHSSIVRSATLWRETNSGRVLADEWSVFFLLRIPFRQIFDVNWFFS